MRFTSVVLGLGLVLSTMTQLRFPGIPLGPGEILLVLYVLAVLPFGLLKWRTVDCGSFFSMRKKLVFSYLVLFLLLLIGAWLGYRSGVNQYEDSIRDLLAYALCFCVSLGIVVSHDSPQAAFGSLRYLLWTSVVITAVVWLIAFLLGEIGPFNFWYGGYGVRFVSLAMNPNQNALLLISLPFLLLFVLRVFGVSRNFKLAGIVLAAIGLAAGWGTGSAALRLSWLILLPLVILTPILIRDGKRLLTAEKAFLASLFLGALLVFLSSAGIVLAVLEVVLPASTLATLLDVFAPAVHGVMPAIGTSHADRLLLSGGAEWTDRFVLWRNAWLVIKDSFLFGYGPGPLSGLQGPFGGSEAHNSLLDWSMATGVIGGLVLSALALYVAWHCLSARCTDLFFALLALSMFGMAHQVLRHPLVWAMLTLFAIAVSGRLIFRLEPNAVKQEIG
ncbi:hypothetical protein PuT2_05660 [Pusillimonas sp. T2]|uniref:O-antigen ligase family protein n=1 Tax=Pusillimonas sp. T2 TaxID=1548123 RepID=UPI000B9CA9BE|nr:hypothetical protein [Pusillimonas sp. T2]OXR50244.1 hypothetical protein PuT2_05660 [Pusillimonas sp. T2]